MSWARKKEKVPPRLGKKEKKETGKAKAQTRPKNPWLHKSGNLDGRGQTSSAQKKKMPQYPGLKNDKMTRHRRERQETGGLGGMKKSESMNENSKSKGVLTTLFGLGGEPGGFRGGRAHQGRGWEGAMISRLRRGIQDER